MREPGQKFKSITELMPVINYFLNKIIFLKGRGSQKEEFLLLTEQQAQL